MTDRTQKAAKVYAELRRLGVSPDDAFYAARELVRICCPEDSAAIAKAEGR